MFELFWSQQPLEELLIKALTLAKLQPKLKYEDMQPKVIDQNHNPQNE